MFFFGRPFYCVGSGVVRFLYDFSVLSDYTAISRILWFRSCVVKVRSVLSGIMVTCLPSTLCPLLVGSYLSALILGAGEEVHCLIVTLSRVRFTGLFMIDYSCTPDK